MIAIRNIIQAFLKLIFPKTCFICNAPIFDGFLCSEDWNKIHFLQTPACEICFYPFEFKATNNMICPQCLKNRPAYFKAISIMKYDENSKDLIIKFKYFDQTYMAKYFAILMKNQAQNIINDIDYIAPVPLHKLKLIKRRYNQSAILARHLAKITDLPAITDLLKRSVNTKSQSSLNRELRKSNVNKAFAINKKYQKQILGKNILLVDDVITSGATVNSCSMALSKAGVNKVYVITVAKTV